MNDSASSGKATTFIKPKANKRPAASGGKSDSEKSNKQGDII
jgi:hypothetical protein